MYKGDTKPQYFRIPFNIAQTTDLAEEYIDRNARGPIERKQQVTYKTFVEEYLKPEGLLL